MSPENNDAGWARYDAAARRLTLTVHVQPNARESAVAGLHGDALKIRVAAPAADNRANEALIAFIARALAIPNAAVMIRHGHTSRRKIVAIAPIDAGAVSRLFSGAV